ncbi:uncharacterized protein [Dysidea avara]|uniref:uncharacterized protein n=1 Tax=Dysidea avara TaxID=196820 RepID=UPI00332E4D79
MLCDSITCLVLVAIVLGSIIIVPLSIGCCFYCCYRRRIRRRRTLEYYRRLLFEPVSTSMLDDDSQQLLNDSYESYPGSYGGVNSTQLTPQHCMERCKKVLFMRNSFEHRHGSINEVCTICLEEFQNREFIMVCPCQHGFHEKCLLDWFQKASFPQFKCPICKQAIIQ